MSSVTDKVRREVERIRRDATVDMLAHLTNDNLDEWLQVHYYAGAPGKSALQLFIADYPHNQRQVVDYIFRNSQKLRLTSKSPIQ